MKSTSRILIISTILALFSISIWSQGPNKHDERRAKYRSMKIAYFTENLDLTPQEAEKFWPLYNEFEKTKGELMKNRRLKSMEFTQQAEQLSEEEAEEIIDRHIEAREKEINLDIKFHQDLKKILSAKKIMNLYITEVQFREYMLQQFRGGPGKGGQNRGKQSPTLSP